MVNCGNEAIEGYAEAKDRFNKYVEEFDVPACDF